MLKVYTARAILSRMYHASKYKVDIPESSVTDYIFRRVGNHGHKVALIDGINDRGFTFDQLHEEVRHVTNSLGSLGLKHGDVACLCGTNVPEFAHVFCSVTSLGAALTIANSQLTPGEILQQVKDTNSHLLFTTEDCAEKALQVQKSSNNQIKNVIVFGSSTNCISFEDLKKEGPEVDLPVIEPESDVALIPFSSGTTGLPKGVQLTHRNIVAELAALSHPLFLPFNNDDSSLSALPMVHIAGLVIGMLNPLSQGATVVTLPRFQPEAFLSSLQKHRVSFSLIAPPVVNFLASDPLVDKFDLSHWTTPYSGAASLGAELTMKMVTRLNLKGIRQGYGMSEASPATHTTPLDGWKYGSIGVPLPNTECKIMDIESRRDLGVDQQGEIMVRGPQIMKGYLNNPAATRETFTDDGWMRTGDIGYFDKDGHYFVVDRLKEIIKYKGYQISPVYLESILLSHQSVEDAAVVGIPHGVDGHLPTAFVVCNNKTPESTLADFVNSKVAPYKQLRGGVHIVKEIPRLPSGKILRRKLV
ncbi:uncharacterized protein LOC132719909 [Ruditapes philippinarum]|uniref:uncharacterized protein LOC132719909 n=1 Tax=Ruditapes philippinarum TaxID=129788 RepID=UPI00295A65CA|nr:uncharacterized protein LOC132719909 [Ruditapes philippinarum]